MTLVPRLWSLLARPLPAWWTAETRLSVPPDDRWFIAASWLALVGVCAGLGLLRWMGLI
jgi:hypothetical protein